MKAPQVNKDSSFSWYDLLVVLTATLATACDGFAGRIDVDSERVARGAAVARLRNILKLYKQVRDK